MYCAKPMDNHIGLRGSQLAKFPVRFRSPHGHIPAPPRNSRRDGENNLFANCLGGFVIAIITSIITLLGHSSHRIDTWPGGSRAGATSTGSRASRSAGARRPSRWREPACRSTSRHERAATWPRRSRGRRGDQGPRRPRAGTHPDGASSVCRAAPADRSAALQRKASPCRRPAAGSRNHGARSRDGGAGPRHCAAAPEGTRPADGGPTGALR